MKKSLVLGTCFALVSLSSCISGTDWKCKCERTILNTTFSNDYVILDQPKGDAQKICDFYKDEGNWDSCSLEKL